MQHNHLHLNLQLFQSLQNKQTTYQSPVQQERGTSLCMIFLWPSVAVIRLYSSHLADPHTRLSAASFHKEKFTIASSKLYTTSFLTSSHSCVCVYIYIYNINLFQSYKELVNLLVVSKMFNKVILLYAFCFLSFLSFISTSTKKHTLHLSSTISYNFIYQ